MLDRGDVLDLTGYGDLPVVVNESHAIDAGRYNHALSRDAWKKMPEWIDNPAAVFERTRDGHLTMIGPEKVNRHAVVIGLEPQVGPGHGHGGSRHLVLTAFEKDRGTMRLDRMIEDGDLIPLYVDQRKGPSFFGGSGVSFPGNVAELRASNGSLKTGRDLVKYRAERSEPKFSRADAIDSGDFRRQAVADETAHELPPRAPGESREAWHARVVRNGRPDMIRVMRDTAKDMRDIGRGEMRAMWAGRQRDQDKAAVSFNGDEADAIANIVSGQLRPGRRGHKRGRIREADKAMAVAQPAAWRQRRDAMKATKPMPKGWTVARIEVEYGKAVEAMAARYGVTVETIETWAKPSRGTK
jgi:hypothetical protein